MEKESYEVKQAVYAGMSIYKELINSSIQINVHQLTLDDKKYMSLYLGLLNTNNEISVNVNDKNKISKRLRYNELKTEEYLNLYENHFVEIFNQIDFDSLENYFNYLLNQDIVKQINKAFRLSIESEKINSNKQLVK